MKSWLLAASLLAAAVTTTGVQAADLDDGPPPDRYGAYDDPRYADIYKYPPPPAYGGPPLPRERVYRDNDGDYDRDDYRGPRRYSYSEPRAPYHAGCVSREQIKHRLMRHGWQDFHAADARGEVAVVHARRPSGRLFVLTLDRCSGEIVAVTPLEGRPYGSYAYGPPPRRWDRTY